MSKEVRRQILTMLAEQPGQAIDPAEVARALAGNDEKRWRLLMTPIRREAIKLAEAGRVELRRKGQRIDPAELRGIYRIAKAVPAGEGNSASVFPASL